MPRTRLHRHRLRNVAVIDRELDIRAGEINDPRLQAISRLAADISRNRGKADESLKAAFFAQGFNEKALIDLIAAVTAITFTNYVHGATEVPVDFPKAKSLETATTA